MSKLRFFSGTGTTTGDLRAVQIAEFLGPEIATCNEQAEPGDVCIMVKSFPAQLVHDVEYYVDFGDDENFIVRSLAESSVSLIPVKYITYTSAPVSRLKKAFGIEPVLIPDFHCNFENAVRPERTFNKALQIGNSFACDINFNWLAERLRREACVSFKSMVFDRSEDLTREDVCKALFNSDFFIDFRKDYMPVRRSRIMQSSLKLLNAMAFGVPAICYPREGYLLEGFQDCFHPAFDIDGIIAGVRLLQESETYYQHMLYSGLEKAKKFHISVIAELYKELLL